MADVINLKVNYVYKRHLDRTIKDNKHLELEKSQPVSSTNLSSLIMKNDSIISVSEDELIEKIAPYQNLTEPVERLVSQFIPFTLTANDKAIIHAIESVYIKYGDDDKKTYHTQITGGYGGLFIFLEQGETNCKTLMMGMEEFRACIKSIEGNTSTEHELRQDLIEAFEDQYFENGIVGTERGKERFRSEREAKDVIKKLWAITLVESNDSKKQGENVSKIIIHNVI
ncbi:hypothetical protein RYG35_001599 [Vibrio parahaemolyticus]|nr:hypothetical protein [Vibrio parahaemolyticus]ELM4049843.1 hypothetical protein [Vibrio parahaemolyticus]